LYQDTNFTSGFLVQIIQGYGAGAPELGILRGAGALLKIRSQSRSSVQNLGPEWDWEL